MKNIFKPLAKSVLISLGSRPAASPTDVAVYKKTFGSSRCPWDLATRTTTLII